MPIQMLNLLLEGELLNSLLRNVIVEPSMILGECLIRTCMTKSQTFPQSNFLKGNDPLNELLEG